MEHLISQFIDDELDLNEKTVFVRKVHADEEFMNSTVELLETEKILRGEPVVEYPRPVPVRPGRARWALRTASLTAAAAVLAFVLALSFYRGPNVQSADTIVPFRFVLYQPEAESAEIVGTFTDWQQIPLHRNQDTGYWEVTLRLPHGEHRFSYVIDGKRRLPDPTMAANERDDFGGLNSILTVGAI